ncbi:hypothetical protein Tco_1119377, partial [Tanacetum coccineum]
MVQGDDSLDEMSMKSVHGIFLGGFSVEDLALEAMVFKEWDRGWLFAGFGGLFV